MSIGEPTLSIACDTTRTQFLSLYYCTDSSVRKAPPRGLYWAQQFQILHSHNFKVNRREKQIDLSPAIPTTSYGQRLARIPIPEPLPGPSNMSVLKNHIAPSGVWRVITPTWEAQKLPRTENSSQKEVWPTFPKRGEWIQLEIKINKAPNTLSKINWFWPKAKIGKKVDI